jgi:hypothetical protein
MLTKYLLANEPLEKVPISHLRYSNDDSVGPSSYTN